MFKESRGREAERYEDIPKLARFLEAVAKRYRSEGVPVNSNGRIDMQTYIDFYPQHIDRDMEQIKEQKTRWEEERGTFSGENLQNLGEGFEMLATAIFAKNLGDQFIIARSSEFDDIFHKVDTILLDRETGNLICAFDEVGDTTGASYERKLTSIRDRNRKGGATLKYGIAMKIENNKKEVVRSPAKNIPLFYIALSSDRIEKGIEEFAFDGQSDFEKKLFEYFIATLDMQIKALELDPNQLHPDLRKRLAIFKEAMERLGKKNPK